MFPLTLYQTAWSLIKAGHYLVRKVGQVEVCARQTSAFCLQSYLNHLREPKAQGWIQIHRLLSEFISPQPSPRNEFQMLCRRKVNFLRGRGCMEGAGGYWRAVGGSCYFLHSLYCIMYLCSQPKKVIKASHTWNGAETLHVSGQTQHVAVKASK